MMNTKSIKIILSILIATICFYLFGHYWGAQEDTYTSLEVKTENEDTGSKTENHVKKEEYEKKRRMLHGLLNTAEERKLANMSDEDKAAEPNSRNLSPVELTRNAIRNSVISEQFLDRAPDLLERMLAEQKKNSIWTAVVTKRLNEQLEKLPDKQTGALREVSCYETICKIVTAHDSIDSAEKFYTEASSYEELGGPGHRFAKKNGENITSTSYKARIGEDRVVHDDVFNKMYEEITGERVEDIAPTDDQINKVLEELRGGGV